MAKIKILVDFSHYRDAELDQKANFIIGSMSGNAAFPDPVPDIAAITMANDEYITARRDAETGDHEKIAIKNQKRAILEDLLGKLGLYVQANGKNDEAILISSGFSLKKDREPVGMLPKPTGFSVHATEQGMVQLDLNAIKGADSYRFEYRLPEDPNWTVRISTKSDLLLTGLESGKQYEFRVAGIGSNPERVYSDVLHSFVL